jgi:hypothetical protein
VITEFSLASLIDHNRIWLPVYMICAQLLQVFALYIFIGAVCRYFGVYNRKTPFFVFCGILVSWIGYTTYSEVSYWFIGNVAYGLSLTLALLVFALEQISFERRSTGLAVLNMFLAALLGGMGIQSGAVICLFLLMINISEIVKLRKINWWYGAPSLVTAAGFIVHITAPGNFVRSEVSGAGGSAGGMDIAGALTGSVYAVATEVLSAFWNPYFFITLIVIFLLGLRSLGMLKVSTGNMIFSLAAGFVFEISAIVTVFTGAGGRMLEDVANRCLYVYDFVTFCVLSFLAYEFGVFLKDRAGQAFLRYIAFAGAALIAAVTVLRMSDMIYGAAWKAMISDLAYNDIQNYNKQVEEVLSMIEESGEEDVVIDELPECPDTFNPFIITNDPDDWLNTAVAGYYNKKSVRTGK